MIDEAAALHAGAPPGAEKRAGVYDRDCPYRLDGCDCPFGECLADFVDEDEMYDRWKDSEFYEF